MPDNATHVHVYVDGTGIDRGAGALAWAFAVLAETPDGMHFVGFMAGPVVISLAPPHSFGPTQEATVPSMLLTRGLPEPASQILTLPRKSVWPGLASGELSQVCVCRSPCTPTPPLLSIWLLRVLR